MEKTNRPRSQQQRDESTNERLGAKNTRRPRGDADREPSPRAGRQGEEPRQGVTNHAREEEEAEQNQLPERGEAKRP